MTGKKSERAKIDFTGKLTRSHYFHETYQEMPNSFKMTIKAEDYIDAGRKQREHLTRLSVVSDSLETG